MLVVKLWKDSGAPTRTFWGRKEMQNAECGWCFLWLDQALYGIWSSICFELWSRSMLAASVMHQHAFIDFQELRCRLRDRNLLFKRLRELEARFYACYACAVFEPVEPRGSKLHQMLSYFLLRRQSWPSKRTERTRSDRNGRRALGLFAEMMRNENSMAIA